MSKKMANQMIASHKIASQMKTSHKIASQMKASHKIASQMMSLANKIPIKMAIQTNNQRNQMIKEKNKVLMTIQCRKIRSHYCMKSQKVKL